MAEFTEVMMQAHRMCAMQKRCEECPGWDVKESFCRKCKNAPMPAEFAEKLGIKPKEARE